MYNVKTASTAQPLLFLMVQSSDHLTGATGLTPTVVIRKAGGTFAGPSGAVSEVGNGWYQVAGNATDTGTLGPLILHATAGGADPTDAVFAVVAFDPLSATNLGLSALPASAAPGASGGLPTVDASNGVKLSVGTGTGQIAATSGKVPATIASGDYAGNTPQTGDLYAVVNPMVTSHVFTAPALANAPTGSGTSDVGPLSGTVASATDATHFVVDLGQTVTVANLTGKTLAWADGAANAPAGPTISSATHLSGTQYTLVIAYTSPESGTTPVVGDPCVVTFAAS